MGLIEKELRKENNLRGAVKSATPAIFDIKRRKKYNSKEEVMIYDSEYEFFRS